MANTNNAASSLAPTATAILPNADIAIQARFPGLVQVNDSGVQVNLASSEAQLHNQQSNAKANIAQSLAFLESVQAQLGGTEHPLYQEFVLACKDFHFGVLDQASMLKQIIYSFRGYPAIVEGMNAFVPEGWKMEIISEDARHFARLITPHETIEFPVEDFQAALS